MCILEKSQDGQFIKILSTEVPSTNAHNRDWRDLKNEVTSNINSDLSPDSRPTWATTCYGYASSNCKTNYNIISGTDVSPEEARVLYLYETRQGNVEKAKAFETKLKSVMLHNIADLRSDMTNRVSIAVEGRDAGKKSLLGSEVASELLALPSSKEAKPMIFPNTSMVLKFFLSFLSKPEWPFLDPAAYVPPPLSVPFNWDERVGGSSSNDVGEKLTEAVDDKGSDTKESLEHAASASSDLKPSTHLEPPIGNVNDSKVDLHVDATKDCVPLTAGSDVDTSLGSRKEPSSSTTPSRLRPECTEEILPPFFPGDFPSVLQRPSLPVLNTGKQSSTSHTGIATTSPLRSQAESSIAEPSSTVIDITSPTPSNAPQSGHNPRRRRSPKPFLCNRRSFMRKMQFFFNFSERSRSSSPENNARTVEGEVEGMRMGLADRGMEKEGNLSGATTPTRQTSCESLQQTPILQTAPSSPQTPEVASSMFFTPPTRPFPSTPSTRYYTPKFYPEDASPATSPNRKGGDNPPANLFASLAGGDNPPANLFASLVHRKVDEATTSVPGSTPTQPPANMLESLLEPNILDGGIVSPSGAGLRVADVPPTPLVVSAVKPHTFGRSSTSTTARPASAFPPLRQPFGPNAALATGRPPFAAASLQQSFGGSLASTSARPPLGAGTMQSPFGGFTKSTIARPELSLGGFTTSTINRPQLSPGPIPQMFGGNPAPSVGPHFGAGPLQQPFGWFTTQNSVRPQLSSVPINQGFASGPLEQPVGYSFTSTTPRTHLARPAAVPFNQLFGGNAVPAIGRPPPALPRVVQTLSQPAAAMAATGTPNSPNSVNPANIGSQNFASGFKSPVVALTPQQAPPSAPNPFLQSTSSTAAARSPSSASAPASSGSVFASSSQTTTAGVSPDELSVEVYMKRWYAIGEKRLEELEKSDRLDKKEVERKANTEAVRYAKLEAARLTREIMELSDMKMKEEIERKAKEYGGRKLQEETAKKEAERKLKEEASIPTSASASVSTPVKAAPTAIASKAAPATGLTTSKAITSPDPARAPVSRSASAKATISGSNSAKAPTPTTIANPAPTQPSRPQNPTWNQHAFSTSTANPTPAQQRPQLQPQPLAFTPSTPSTHAPTPRAPSQVPQLATYPDFAIPEKPAPVNDPMEDLLDAANIAPSWPFLHSGKGVFRRTDVSFEEMRFMHVANATFNAAEATNIMEYLQAMRDLTHRKNNVRKIVDEFVRNKFDWRDPGVKKVRGDGGGEAFRRLASARPWVAVPARTATAKAAHGSSPVGATGQSMSSQVGTGGGQHVGNAFDQQSGANAGGQGHLGRKARRRQRQQEQQERQGTAGGDAIPPSTLPPPGLAAPPPTPPAPPTPPKDPLVANAELEMMSRPTWKLSSSSLTLEEGGTNLVRGLDASMDEVRVLWYEGRKKGKMDEVVSSFFEYYPWK
ncbi:hypothetical protein HDU97_007104 [Phlyctochytrium planicorne]|nr:hypothetical protein HDU97_007104 [Phlyctochytrium planicorne]